MIDESAIDRLRRAVTLPASVSERYELHEVIGRGGMGTVYRATDRELERDVAVKVVNPEIASPETVRRMAAEARTVAALEHPAVVPIHDAGLSDASEVWYVMKLVRGASLRDAITSSSLQEGLRAFLRIAEAVGFAHSRGVVHGDLKPGNVMVGEFGEVVVLDWGVSSRIGQGSETRAGTPKYMPPEAESEAATESNDIYALGILLSEMAEAVGDAEQSRLMRQPLKAIIERATHSDPSLRYRSVSELAADVEAVLDDGEVTAWTPSAWNRMERWLHRNSAAVVVIVTYMAMRLLLFAIGR